MENFKYYRRGTGELDTSNFPDLIQQGYVHVETLNEKTFMSLMALNDCDIPKGFMVIVEGYVAHLRADKDFYSPANLYRKLDRMEILCSSIQHEDTPEIKGAQITTSNICTDLGISQWFTTFYGADKSVPKFAPFIVNSADKLRAFGKVVSLDFNAKPPTKGRVVIVDDLLGGGATIQMLLDKLRNDGYTGEVFLWVAYNEGIHTTSFLDQFNGCFIGDRV